MITTWASLILTALKILNAIMGAVNREKWMQAGADAEIAKAALAILERTDAGKKIMERVSSMTDAEVDVELRKLEP